MALKNDYKTAVLDYLKKNPGVNITRDVLMSKTKVSKSRLTEVLHSIRVDGYTLITPPRSGIVRLEISDNMNILPPIKDYDIRRWLILFLLSINEKLTFIELLSKLLYMHDNSSEELEILTDIRNQNSIFDDSALIKALRNNLAFSEDTIDVAKDMISVTAFRKDLNTLRKQGLISMTKSFHTEYQLTNAAPYIIPISGDTLYQFCQHYSESVSSISEVTPLKQAYERIKHLIGYEDCDVSNGMFGRINDIKQEQIDSFESFVVHPYKTNLLKIDGVAFAVGLIFYSVETENFYVLGKNVTDARIECRRIDRIKDIKVLEDKHKEYHIKKYYRIYEEMFSAHYEDTAYKVKVLYTDFGNVHKRFSDLQSVRTNATIRKIVDKQEDCDYDYVYEDTIRGLSDFAKYLRGFGISVLALEPTELKEKMLFTYNRIVAKYEELYEEHR